MWCDEALVFESTKVRYSAAVSEPRRRHRRYTVASPAPSLLIDYLELTPVRRSTRAHRSGPGLALDRTLCFDSPSQANAEEIKVLPNKALVMDP